MTTRVVVAYTHGMQIEFVSAYKQLMPAQKVLVDQIVRELETAADRTGERITMALDRPIPTELLARDSREMLQIPLVQAAIHERVKEIGAQRDLTPQLWLKHTMAGAFASMGDFLRMVETVDPHTLETTVVPVWDFSKATPEQLMAIESIEWDASKGMTTKMKIKLANKAVYLQMLGKYMGMVEPDNPHWQAKRPDAEQQAIPTTASVDEAANRYQRLLENNG